MAKHSIHCPHNSRDEELAKSVREAMAKSVATLKQNPNSDTFLGRKTQEPFPKGEEEEEHMTRWMTSKELQPPK